MGVTVCMVSRKVASRKRHQAAMGRSPRFWDLRVRVSQQPAGFGATNQQADSVGRFLANIARQLRQRGVEINGPALVKAGVANNIFKTLQFDAKRAQRGDPLGVPVRQRGEFRQKERGLPMKSERVSKAFFSQYPLLARMLSRHTRTFSSADYIQKWPVEDKILYLASICCRGIFKVVEQGGKKYRIWTQQILPVNEALDLIEARYRGMDPKSGKPKSEIPDKHFEIMREVFPRLEQNLKTVGLDWDKVRKIKVPNYIELMPEKPATAK